MTKVQRPGLRGSIAAFLVILAAFAAYSFAVRPWFLRWGASDEDQTRPLLGDDVWIGGAVSGTRAVTIQAPPEKVWPWLVQIGQDRAGFYSYSWLENLILADIHNTLEVRPEWQAREAKDFIRSVKRGYMFGLLKEREGYTGWKVPFVAPGQSMTLKKWGTFALEPTGEGGTRFLARGRGEPIPGVAGRLFAFWLLDPAHFIMEKKMMTEIKRLAEGRPGPPGWLRVLAITGFAAAALGAALVIASRRKKWPWLILPALAAIAILRETADLRAGLVGFTALALVIVGFLAFGKRWWIYFGLFWIASYAVLFLAADAFIVFGLVFLAAVAVLAATALKGLPSR
jgi:hypothetical protein